MIVSHIAYGYIYLSAYYWISIKDNKDLNHVIFKSVVVNYILITAFGMFIEKFNIVFGKPYYEMALYIILSAVLGFAAGKIITCRWFNHLLHILHVGRTTNDNIWDDVKKPDVWLRVYMKNGVSYYGRYRFGEPFKSEPIIVLETYRKLDEQGKTIYDFTEDQERFIMINTKNFDRIEFASSKKK